MASFAKTIILGNLGRDPETRYLPSGDAVCNFSVAVTESWKDKASGEKKENTTWYRVNAFGKLAEICGQYLKKGVAVLIEGRMQARKWTDKDGAERESWELKADTMQMVGGKSEAGGHAAGSAEAKKPASGGAGGGKPSFDDLDDNIPF